MKSAHSYYLLIPLFIFFQMYFSSPFPFSLLYNLINTKLNPKYEPASKDAYLKYEPLAEQYVAAVWRSLNRIPLFPQVAQIMVPTAAYWCEKYNDAVTYAAQKGYTVSHYLPKVPVERIGKVFQGKGQGEENHPTISGNGEALAVPS